MFAIFFGKTANKSKYVFCVTVTCLINSYTGYSIIYIHDPFTRQNKKKKYKTLSI